LNKLTQKILTLILIFFCLAVSTSVIKAQVVINEFSSFSYPGDWVEVYNYGPDPVDLSSYRIRDSSLTQYVNLSGVLEPQKFTFFDLKDYLNKTGDVITLKHLTDGIEDVQPIMTVCYGDKVDSCSVIKVGCYPLENESVGSYPSDGGNTFERFTTATKGVTNQTALLDPCPTPTTTETAVATETQTATLTQTSTLTSTTTKTPTKKVTPTATVVAEDSPVQENTVLGLRNDLTTDAPTAGVSGETAEGKKLPPMAIILIVVGTLVLGGSGFAFIKKVREDKRSPNEQNPPVY
jgi:hypothetical protein